MFLMKYFYLNGILPFFKSYREIESTWSTAKCSLLKVFWNVILYSYLCKTLCKFFIKIGSNCFSKTYSEIESMWPTIQTMKKLFRHVIVKNYLCNVSWKFLIKIEIKWRREMKEQATQLTLLYRGRIVRSSHRRCCIRKLFLKILQYSQETPVLCWSPKVADL